MVNNWSIREQLNVYDPLSGIPTWITDGNVCLRGKAIEFSPGTQIYTLSAVCASSFSPDRTMTIKTGPEHSITVFQINKSLRCISHHPTLTPYRRRVYCTLLSIPPGRWTTYSALATYLGSSARAVGNAMRTNPLAPEVPCHRVLAVDRSLCGYKGMWSGGRRGNLEEKRRLLETEGVEFGTDGKARGVCFEEFQDLGSRRNG